MSLPQNLLALCETMLPGENQRGRPDAATLKRCISTAYYAVFSLLVHAASNMLAGNSAGQKELRGYVARAFSHNEMAEACKGFAGGNLNKELKPCLQSAISTDLKDIAATFRSLQQSRHDADYNILQKPKKTDARQAIQDAKRVFQSWDQVKGSDETRIFLLALLVDERVKNRS
jgi:uncharacterized protein (UPF0332 family)